jgi:hypothetical protein
MIKRYIYFFLVVATLAGISGFIIFQPAPVINNTPFGKGEVMEYRAHYGFLNAAVAKMIIDDSVFQVNGRPCYKIDIFGESVGMFDLMLRIRDNWGSYLDTAKVVPQRFWRKIREGKYRKFEIVDFDQNENYATVVKYDYKKKKWRDKTYYDIPLQCQDMVSGYYYLRTLDFSRLRKRDIIVLNGFFDDETYNFEIRYLGKENLKTDIGEFRTHVFAPIMPKNSLFKGEDSIQFWLSDDENKIPLKIRANMFVGAVEIDITSYQPGKR